MKAMVILKKKKEETINVGQIKQIMEPEKEDAKQEYQEPEQIRVEEPSVPLFVKIDKYKNILDITNDIKSVLFFAKNTLAVQRQIEILVNENRKLLEDSINKLEEKIMFLDRELTKPGVYESKKTEQQPEKEIDNVLDELRKQIESLKSDLKSIA
ncbi:MAG: hypothetical protein QXF88_01140 [Candidatus Aenigmatarchaeota archaeon]